MVTFKNVSTMIFELFKNFIYNFLRNSNNFNICSALVCMAHPQKCSNNLLGLESTSLILHQRVQGAKLPPLRPTVEKMKSRIKIDYKKVGEEKLMKYQNRKIAILKNTKIPNSITEIINHGSRKIFSPRFLGFLRSF